MENAKDDEYDQLRYNGPSLENEQISPKFNRKISSPKKPNRKDVIAVPKKLSLIDEIEKSKEDKDIKDDLALKILKEHKKVKKVKILNDKDGDAKPSKKDGTNKKFLRKNAKKNISSPKKRRGGGKIKIVGKVSAKLSSLIQRLQQQNPDEEEDTKAKFFDDKVVMAPRIKAALEKFNKKRQEEPK